VFKHSGKAGAGGTSSSNGWMAPDPMRRRDGAGNGAGSGGGMRSGRDVITTTAPVKWDRRASLGRLASIPNGVFYWLMLLAVAAAVWLAHPFAVTASYVTSCTLLTAWGHVKGEGSKYQPTERQPGWASPRRRRSLAVSLLNCVIADVLMTRYVRNVTPRLLHSFPGVPSAAAVGWWYISPAFLLLLMDAWFYATHRALHAWPTAYRQVHSMHHTVSDPEAWDLFYMHPAEAVGTVVVPLVLAPRLFPLHWVIWEGMVLKGILIDCYGHCGFEAAPFHPFKLTQFSLLPRLPWKKIFLTARHHDDHHKHRGGNYALYLRLWDTACGTWIEDGSQRDDASRCPARSEM